MGNLQAAEFAQAVNDNEISLESALSWHLTANHFPSLPTEYVALLSEVIQSVNAGNLALGDWVTLPDVPTIPSRAVWDEELEVNRVLVGDLILLTHCEHFIDDEEIFDAV